MEWVSKQRKVLREEASWGVLAKAMSTLPDCSRPSTWWLRCGNFLRFKTMEVGYTFKLCRVYVNGDNIAVWSPFKYWDPELNYNTYPLSRTFNVGVQFKF